MFLSSKIYMEFSTTRISVGSVRLMGEIRFRFTSGRTPGELIMRKFPTLSLDKTQYCAGDAWLETELPRRGVAIKVLPSCLSDTTRERFERKAQTISSLNHPNTYVA